MPLSGFIFGHVDLLSTGLPLSTTWMFSSFDRPLSSLQNHTERGDKRSHSASQTNILHRCPTKDKLKIVMHKKIQLVLCWVGNLDQEFKGLFIKKNLNCDCFQTAFQANS